MNLLTKYRVVLDTNVIISATLYGGNSEKIIRLFTANKFGLILSHAIITEIVHKLKELQVENSTTHSLENLFSLYAIYVKPTKKLHICRDPKDNMFLEAAVEGKADFLITGDKDLLILKKVKDTLIISPAEFLKMVTL